MSTRAPTGKLLVKLVLTAVAMFAFAIFVMPPLYNLLCEITGIGGKTKGS
jgi:cytochrome c oxidase assembly protein subunit 11